MMKKIFNVSGSCYPEEHYMVNMEGRLYEIEKLVDEKKYFTINRARQCGKTTLLNLMVTYLSFAARFASFYMMQYVMVKSLHWNHRCKASYTKQSRITV